MFLPAHPKGVIKDRSNLSFVRVYTATEYGGELLQENFGTMFEIISGRLDENAVNDELVRWKPGFVVDCTHPHALCISQNLTQVCKKNSTPYLRVSRGDTPLPPGLDVQFVDTLQEAALYLAGKEGNILLATGSKELAPFSGAPFAGRVFVRVLPVEESITRCRETGFDPRHIIAMQGPFSESMNTALLQETRAAFLVTKDSGVEGGFAEKLAAAAKLGVKAVIIRRPAELAAAMGVHEALELLLGAEAKKKRIAIVGMTGKPETLSAEGRTALCRAAAVLGSQRLLADAEALLRGKTCRALTAAAEIAAYIETESFAEFAVLVSGDTGFYSITKPLLPLLHDAGHIVSLIPALSSLSLFAAKLGTSWDDSALFSLHGRRLPIAAVLAAHKKIFFLTDREMGPAAVCKELCRLGLGGWTVHTGEQLGYDDEKIRTGTARCFADEQFDALSVVMIENPAPCSPALSFDDTQFIRGAVPMSKEEVRAVSIAKLRLTADAVVWDIGAGTGAMAVEIASRLSAGQVYAVEQDETALALLAQNRQKFSVFNLEIVAGHAPEALAALPSPSHVFIGGVSGQLEPVLELILAKNPQCRVVMNAVTLETISESKLFLQKFPVGSAEVVHITVAKTEKMGRYHLFKALNPIFIISGGGR